MFVSPAYAQAAPAAPGFDLISLLPLVLIFVVFYFLLIRPQQKKVKEHKALVAGLRRGDRIVTSGGIIGLVTKVVSDTELQVEIAPDVRVRVVRSMVTDVLSKAAPADAEEAGDDETEGKERGRQASGKSR